MFFFFFLSIYIKISIFTTGNCFLFRKGYKLTFHIPHHSTIYVDLLLIYNFFYDRS